MIEELQKAIFERQGVKGDWGIKCLAAVNATYKSDPEFLKRFYTFVSKCVTVLLYPRRPMYWRILRARPGHEHHTKSHLVGLTVYGEPYRRN